MADDAMINELMATALHGSGPAWQAAIQDLQKKLPPISTTTYRLPSQEGFQSHILAKREFYQRRTSPLPDVTNFENAAEAACTIQKPNDAFQLLDSQAFVRNFLSPKTPFGGLLLYHDVGVGKTCSAISVAERFPERKVLVLAPLGVHASFRRQLFDPAKVTVFKPANGGQLVVRSNQCTGTSFLTGLVDVTMAGGDEELDRDEINAQVQRRINRRYTFSGFNRFANTVSKLSDAEVKVLYSNHVIIVDEAHNLRTQPGTGTKPSYRALQRVLEICQGVKLLLLTATPMFNDAREIVDLVNLLLINDKRSPLLSRKDLFGDDGSLIGAKVLAQTCRGYISYVTGRNPLRFPILLDPGIDRDVHTIKDPLKQLPVLDMQGRHIPPAELLQHTANLLGSVMSRTQYTAYMEMSDTALILHAEASTSDDLVDEEVVANPEDVDDIAPSFRPGFEASNIVFPMLPGAKKHAKGSASMFWTCFQRMPGKEFAVEYTRGGMAGANGGFLSQKHLGEYSCKFATIIKRILSSSGITFVYSRFLWAGLVPFAIALEHAGFHRHGQRNILSSSRRSDSMNSGQYIMLTSDSQLCSKARFARDLEAVTSADNANGQRVRVILACGVATEGIDFKCVRAVHLIDPWYHSNKVHQIIGRASRNCSHAALSVAHRNVTVYLHAALPPADIPIAAQLETVDLNAYRISEYKQRRIEVVEKLLRAVSVDCELNRHSQQAEALENARVDLETAQGTIVKAYPVMRSLHGNEGLTCIIDQDAGLRGTDDSTYDPWYHAPDLIDAMLGAIDSTFEALHETVVGHARLLQETQASLELQNTVFDADIFEHALQRAVENGTLDYRGGVYMRPTARHLHPSTQTLTRMVSLEPLLQPRQHKTAKTASRKKVHSLKPGSTKIE